MSKVRRVWVCQQCGHQAAKWVGRCTECKAWNTLVEEVQASGSPSGRATPGAPAASPVPLSQIAMDRGGEVRLRTGLGELDTPLGGGLVAGSLVLLGGDPGVGKSTILLMACERLARRGPVLYVTGEESLQQVRMRADRLGVTADRLLLLSATDFTEVERVVGEMSPIVVVVDSVQTVWVPELQSIPGSVSQIREVAHRAMLLAKGGRTAVFLVGHVTKSGELAGPKVLEHFVDTVLYFEGDGRSSLRILRSVKNRFGATGELGLFEMAGDGLREVPDASARLLEERLPDTAGTVVVAAIEGTRPLLAEVQALVGRPGMQMPARTTVGVDRARVSMLAAVLGKVGLHLHDRDLFVNAAGGLRLIEPAADLAVVAAIVSSLQDRPVPEDVLCFGEVGLVGEVRNVTQPGVRLREAARQGFRRVVAPAHACADAPAGVEVVGVRSVRDALSALF